MTAKNDHLKQVMNNIYKSLNDKNKEIAKLKVVKVDFDHQIIEKDKEITHVRATLDSSKNEARDAQWLKLTMKELGNSCSSFNAFQTILDNTQAQIKELENKYIGLRCPHYQRKKKD